MLDPVEMETGPTPDWAVIWLHGLGADGHDFEGIVPEIPLPGSARVRFVFPHAPVMRVRINGGAPMRAWYDVAAPDLSRAPDLDGMKRSVTHLRALSAREMARGIPPERIILAGFSQGGVIALLTVFTGTEKWGGVLALSTYIPLDAGLVLSDNGTPLLMAHGTEDGIVPLGLGKRSFEVLRSLGMAGPKEWAEYPMGHSVCLREIGDIGSWMTGLMKVRGS